MSTDFLNRRMDLKHTSLSENYLTMDTSYPVKLAGKVLKLFTASSDFNTNKYTTNYYDGSRGEKAVNESFGIQKIDIKINSSYMTLLEELLKIT